MLDITILGNTGTYPMPNRHLTQACVQYDGYSILIDCGEGSLVAMMKSDVQGTQIDAILLTHMHGDHILGITGLVQTMSLLGREKPLNIYGDKMALRTAFGLIKFASCKFKINYIEINEKNIGNVLNFKDLSVQAFPLNHSTTVYGYTIDLKRKAKFNRDKAIENDIPIKYWNRLQHGETVTDDNGRVLSPSIVLGDERKGLRVVYITDTRPCKQMLTAKTREPDLLIIEQMYFSKEDESKAHKNKHMMLEEQLKVQMALNAKQTVLTHLATSVFPNQLEQEIKNRNIKRRVRVAKCGEKIQLRFED